MTERTAGGIQSLDAALHLLKTLAASGGAATLTELARSAGMPATKAHRYLASFAAAGFVEQRERSGRYDLGPSALAVGLAAMARSEIVNKTADHLAALTEETGLTALLSVWGEKGAIVVRWERAAAFVVTSLGLGTTLPLLNSATGHVFLAFTPWRLTEPALDREHGQMNQAAGSGGSNKNRSVDIEALRRRIRDDGFSAVDGRFIPGLAAIAAPVLDWQGEAAAAVTLIATDGGIACPDGLPVRSLKAFCTARSADGSVSLTG